MNIQQQEHRIALSAGMGGRDFSQVSEDERNWFKAEWQRSDFSRPVRTIYLDRRAA